MKNWKRVLSCTLVVSLVLASMGSLGASQMVSAEEKEIAMLENTLEQVTSGTGMALHSATAGKKETVYVIMDGNGTQEKTIVSTVLKNADGNENLEDYSELQNIKVVKGNSTCESNQAGMIEWKTDGSDIYYQGTTDKKLPVDVRIKYELDGKVVAADELAGASGHLKITFAYQNNEKKEVVVNGETCEIYQPFTMVSGLILDNSKVVNVEVTNGDVVDSGEQTMAFGLAMPGLAQSLGLDKVTDEEGKLLDVDIPEEVVVEADVRDFSLVMSLTIASNNALEKVGLDGIDSLDDLKDDMEKLKSGMGDIVDGATQLSEGVGKLSDGTGTLSNGVSDLNTGAKELHDGAYELANGASALNEGASQLSAGLGELKNSAPTLAEGVSQLVGGADQLAAGMSQIIANNDGLNSGAAQIADGLGQLNTALSDENAANQIAALIQGSADFSTGLNNAAQGLANIQTGYDYNSGDLAAVIGGLSGYAQVLMQNPETAAYGNYIMALVGAYQGLYDNTAAVAGGVATLNGSYAGINGGIGVLSQNVQTVAGAVGTLYAGATQLQTGIGAYTAGVSSAAEGVGTVDSGLNSLNSMIPTLVAGINQLSDGADSLASGTEKLKNGSNSLASGTDALASGTNELQNGVGDLVSGVSELLNGSVELKDGVIKYDEEGIDKLYNAINDSITVYYERLKAVQDYAKEYASFAGCEEGIESSVRFIYKTDEIK